MNADVRLQRLAVGFILGGMALFAVSCASQSAAPQSESPTDDGMIALPGRTFLMGSDDGYPEERPVREVTVGPFRIDRTEVTNRQFAAFVAATGYVTLAERTPDAKDYPDADPAMLVAGSAVFIAPGSNERASELSWWRYVPGANWKHPEGPGSTIDDRLDHPVVHVAFEDAQAYAAWAGKRLPTEAEWEYAARGGLVSKPYAWGDEFTPDGRHMANTWQGAFPYQNSRDDGFQGTAPVGHFPPNGFGLHDMAGNVWEWTVTEADGNARFTKGGSFLCAPNYCQRYRPAARSPVTADTSTSHIGFRCVRSETHPQDVAAPTGENASSPAVATESSFCCPGSRVSRPPKTARAPR